MFNLDHISKKDDNKDWPYRKLIIGPSGSGKTNYLLNSIQRDNNVIDKIYLYPKDLEDPKYQFLINKREKAGLKNLNDPTAFIEHSSAMDDIFENIEDYNKKRKRKVLIVFDDMISHVMSNKKAQQVLKDLFIRSRKLNISWCFLTLFNSCFLSYFSVPKDVRLNSTHYIIFKLNSKRELQNTAINHSVDIDYKDFVNIYRNCTKEPYNLLTIDTTQPVDKRFKKNFNDPLQKMTINEQIKILDNKIRSNQAQCDLDRQNAKIYAVSRGELDKYEYLTGEDLGYKPDVVQKTKFEYSPLSQVFNKGLDSNQKKKAC